MIKGFIVVDKPQGMTSADVVYQVKRKLPKGTKIGHAGTLDPNVTGVLPLAIGTGTKAFAFLDDSQKAYRVSFRLGISTDTEDIWGTVLETASVPTISLSRVKEVLEEFVGSYWQVPPMYSAKKQGGVKLYDMARKGITVERQACERKIFQFDHIAISNGTPNEQEQYISFTVHCSRGTYIRTLCVDIAKKLGTIGTMTALDRQKTGCFTKEHAMPLAEIIGLETLENSVLPIKMMFESWPKICVDQKHAQHLRNGVKVNLQRFSKSQWDLDTRIGIWLKDHNDHFIGVATVAEDGIWFTQWLGD